MSSNADPNNPSHTEAVMAAINEMYNTPGQPKRVGLVLLMFPYGVSDGQANYVSNGANREDMILFLEETAKRLRQREDNYRLPYAFVQHRDVPVTVGSKWDVFLRQLGVRWDDAEQQLIADQTKLINVTVPRSLPLPTWVTHPVVDAGHTAYPTVEVSPLQAGFSANKPWAQALQDMGITYARYTSVGGGIVHLSEVLVPRNTSLPHWAKPVTPKSN